MVMQMRLTSRAPRPRPASGRVLGAQELARTPSTPRPAALPTAGELVRNVESQGPVRLSCTERGILTSSLGTSMAFRSEEHWHVSSSLLLLPYPRTEPRWSQRPPGLGDPQAGVRGNEMLERAENFSRASEPPNYRGAPPTSCSEAQRIGTDHQTSLLGSAKVTRYTENIPGLRFRASFQHSMAASEPLCGRPNLQHARGQMTLSARSPGPGRTAEGLPGKVPQPSFMRHSLCCAASPGERTEQKASTCLGSTGSTFLCLQSQARPHQGSSRWQGALGHAGESKGGCQVEQQYVQTFRDTRQ